MKKCPSCGTEQNDDNLFCTECGKELPKSVVCPHCGASVNEGDAFCTRCGKSITANESDDLKESQSVVVDSLHLLLLEVCIIAVLIRKQQKALKEVT